MVGERRHAGILTTVSSDRSSMPPMACKNSGALRSWAAVLDHEAGQGSDRGAGTLHRVDHPQVSPPASVVNLTAQVAAPAALEEPHMGVVGQIRSVLLIEGAGGADRGTDKLTGQHLGARPMVVEAEVVDPERVHVPAEHNWVGRPPG